MIFKISVRLDSSLIQVSKLGKLKYKNESHSVQDVKAHDLRQMFLAMTEEVNTFTDYCKVLILLQFQLLLNLLLFPGPSHNCQISRQIT